MPEMNLRQPGFTYGACGPFTKKRKNKKKNQHHMAYGDFKHLNKRTFADKELRYKAFNIALVVVLKIEIFLIKN